MYKPRIEVVFGNERIISPSGLNEMHYNKKNDSFYSRNSAGIHSG